MATAATPKKATAPQVDTDTPAAKNTTDTKVTTTTDGTKDTGVTGDQTSVTGADGVTTTTTDGHTVAAVTEPEPDKADTRTSRKAKVERGECVVDDGTPHTGRAVNGVICSAHAMRYRSDGTLRGAA